nr:uncharacterized protein LOC109178142 [Ipomoea trifida]GMD57873.1 NTF2-like domain containing protein [Ipomoea batatas]
MMACMIPNNPSPSAILLVQQQLQSKDKPQLIPKQLLLLSNSSSSSSSSSLSASTVKLLDLPPSPSPSPSHANSCSTHKPHHKDDFYVNLGSAVRTLRQDLPLLFTKDLNYHIYRDDITFVDPLNTFTGIDNYKLIFWALRFHGRILFREISLEVYRVWQPSENVILIRWNLRGVPRVPWEAKGQFQGTSTYKLDRNGKIYEHKVDNLAFNFPQPLRPPPPASVLDLVTACPAATPFLWAPPLHVHSSWLEFYSAVKDTLDRQTSSTPPQDCFLPCS